MIAENPLRDVQFQRSPDTRIFLSLQKGTEPPGSSGGRGGLGEAGSRNDRLGPHSFRRIGHPQVAHMHKGMSTGDKWSG